MHSCTRKHVIYGNRDGVEVRALASHQCDPGSIPRPCYIYVGWVCYGFCLAPRVFLWVPNSTKKTNKFSKLEFYQDSVPGWKLAKADETSSLNIVVLYVEKGKLLSLTQKGKLSLNSVSSHISFLILQLFICFFYICHIILNPSTQNMYLCFHRELCVHWSYTSVAGR